MKARTNKATAPRAGDILDTFTLACLATCLATLAACDAPDAPDEFGAGDVTRRDCPPWRCGFNSAEVNGRAIRELNLDGAANGAGVKIVGFIAPVGLLGNYQLDVEDDELVAKKPGHTLRGLGLIGAIILVKEPGLLSLPIPITIAGYSEIPSWADDAPDVPTYALIYPDLGSLLGSSNVCVGDLTELLATSATVLGGETYDLDDKEVNPGMTRWFTLACAGSAAAKLRLMNYGPQSDFDGNGNPASVASRQAALKMVTADYCGTGTSYTQNNTPLQYEDAPGTVAVEGTPGDIEAIWTDAGALCLDTTRIANTQVACSLPSCSSFALEDGDWISYVP
jgi:hypothetical protein